jgi:hypothetical protein
MSTYSTSSVIKTLIDLNMVFSAENWDIFMKADLMKLVMSMLEERKLNQGLIILSRHEVRVFKKL